LEFGPDRELDALDPLDDGSAGKLNGN